MPLHLRDESLFTCILNFVNKEATMAPMLMISSDRNENKFPLWLDLCHHLAIPEQVNTPVQRDRDCTYQWLDDWRQKLWGPEGSSPENLASELFVCERSDEQGQSQRVWHCPEESAYRALAATELARAWAESGTSNSKGSGLSGLRDFPYKYFHLPEQVLLKKYWQGESIREPDLRMLVLLIVDGCAPNDRGRLAQLRLWMIDVKEDPLSHGQLFRAPAASLLSLDSGFKSTLKNVERLLKACLTPLKEDGSGAVALAWSLHPLPMDQISRSGQQLEHPWGIDALAGASATVAFAVGALWVFRNQLNSDTAGLRLAQRYLRAIDPGQIAISAQLCGDLPDSSNPLAWRLEEILDLDDKLGCLHVHNTLRSNNEPEVALAIVADNQDLDGCNVQIKRAQDLAGVLEKAYKQVGAPLSEPAEALLQFLLDEPFTNYGLDSTEPQTPLAELELLQPLQPRCLDIKSNQKMRACAGQPNAITWHLLQRYALWSGGEHDLWGEPGRLTQDFQPIKLDPELTWPDRARALRQGVSDSKMQEELRRRSLYDLLHGGHMDPPALWLLDGPPAAGKTTLMVEYEMHMAWRALCRQSETGHFGEVPLWIQCRSLNLTDSGGKPRDLDAAIGLWIQANAPSLGNWPDLLNNSQMNVRVILDGINELPCETPHRHSLLDQWLTVHFPRWHNQLPPLLTVRTLERDFSFNGGRRASLRHWNNAQREAYIQQRLGHDPKLAQTMRDAVEIDIKGANNTDEKMLYSNPGMLSMACTLMEQGLLPGGLMNRARLISTMVWARLGAERKKSTLPETLLGEEEMGRLSNLHYHLSQDAWKPSMQPGPLLDALCAQAWAMQFEHNPRKIEENAENWFKGYPNAKELLKAAQNLNLINEKNGPVVSGQPTYVNEWRHQILLEWFAAYGLTTSGRWPKDVAAPKMERIEKQYADWCLRKRAWEAEQNKDKKDANDLDIDALEGVGFGGFQLLPPSISPQEETIKLAVQLHSDPITWVEQLIRRKNIPLAGRIALENLAAFKEPPYPQDPLGPWRRTRKKNGAIEGTHPVLNKLRRALHNRMYSPTVHLASRIEAGDLLGILGGSPLFRISGDALVLKDIYWMQVGEPGQTYEFEMGNLDGGINEQSAEGTLFKAEIAPFRMAGFLVTKAQFHCFLQCPNFADPAWWPGEAGEWFRWRRLREEIFGISEPSLSPWNKLESGLEAIETTFWLAQAYSLWEQAQRGTSGDHVRGLRLPTEGEWEGAARYPAQRLGQRWQFPYTVGMKLMPEHDETENTTGFTDVKSWDFNNWWFCDLRRTPVGVFLGSNARVCNKELRDLIGNCSEWTTSAYADKLGLAALSVGICTPDRATRSPMFITDGGLSAREAAKVTDHSGFRLVWGG